MYTGNQRRAVLAGLVGNLQKQAVRLDRTQKLAQFQSPALKDSE